MNTSNTPEADASLRLLPTSPTSPPLDLDAAVRTLDAVYSEVSLHRAETARPPDRLLVTFPRGSGDELRVTLEHTSPKAAARLVLKRWRCEGGEWRPIRAPIQVHACELALFARAVVNEALAPVLAQAEEVSGADVTPQRVMSSEELMTPESATS